jgi:hypothetical protein
VSAKAIPKPEIIKSGLSPFEIRTVQFLDADFIKKTQIELF